MSGRGDVSSPSELSDGAIVDEAALDCSLEDLREFLEADLVDVHADPEFKHSLRQRLWDLVQARNNVRRR
jgi:hypothetical protein